MRTRPKLPQNELEERLLSRQQVADRWGVSTETVKRRSREGVLRPIRFNRRLIRYRLRDILQIEQEATGGLR